MTPYVPHTTTLHNPLPPSQATPTSPPRRCSRSGSSAAPPLPSSSSAAVSTHRFVLQVTELQEPMGPSRTRLLCLLKAAALSRTFGTPILMLSGACGMRGSWLPPRAAAVCCHRWARPARLPPDRVRTLILPLLAPCRPDCGAVHGCSGQPHGRAPTQGKNMPWMQLL